MDMKDRWIHVFVFWKKPCCHMLNFRLAPTGHSSVHEEEEEESEPEIYEVQTRNKRQKVPVACSMGIHAPPYPRNFTPCEIVSLLLECCHLLCTHDTCCIRTVNCVHVVVHVVTVNSEFCTFFWPKKSELFSICTVLFVHGRSLCVMGMCKILVPMRTG